MAHASHKHNANNLHKLATNPFKIIAWVLVLVGKPLYYVIVASTIFLIYILYLIKSFIRQLVASGLQKSKMLRFIKTTRKTIKIKSKKGIIYLSKSSTQKLLRIPSVKLDSLKKKAAKGLREKLNKLRLIPVIKQSTQKHIANLSNSKNYIRKYFSVFIASSPISRLGSFLRKVGISKSDLSHKSTLKVLLVSVIKTAKELLQKKRLATQQHSTAVFNFVQTGYQKKRSGFLKGCGKIVALIDQSALSKDISIKLPKTRIAVLMFTLSASFLTATIIIKDFANELPSPQALIEREIPLSTKIYDRNGVLLYSIYKDQNRTYLQLDEIPDHVKLATLAAEDGEFFNHPGFSLRGITRSVLKFVSEGEVTGGSTITQQLVKNTLLTPERTIKRKLKEIILATQVERNFSKEQILEMYFNEVGYGGTAYGIQEAARQYFDKDVDNLTLAEAALLAGLPKSPTRFSPFGLNPELAEYRQKEVLRLMQSNGYIPEQQRFKAEEEKLTYASNTTSISAPHFVMYVRSLLEEKYGEDLVAKGGLEVITTLDVEVQRMAEGVVKEEIDKLVGLNVTNAAVVILDPTNGEIIAMVGSRDYFDLENDGNVNVVISPRQPGSAIKVVNYAYALQNGYTAATILEDTPVTFDVTGQRPYSPRNYDSRFRGSLTLRNALAESRNVPAVKVLASYGVDKMINLGREMGITTWDNPSSFGLSLTLGGGEVKLIDLAQVYATIANYGTSVKPNPVMQITNMSGYIYEKNSCDPQDTSVPARLVKEIQGQTKINLSDQALKMTSKKTICDKENVLDERVAYIITDILKDNNARSPAFGTHSQLVIPNHPEVAVKTGTSNNLRDNLTIGYNKEYLVAVWVGNNDNSPMSRIASGLTGASSIWNRIMTILLTSDDMGKIDSASVVPGEDYWEIPEGLIQLPTCPYTGTLACTGCPVTIEWFLEENTPDKVCNPSWFLLEEDSGGGSPSQFNFRTN